MCKTLPLPVMENKTKVPFFLLFWHKNHRRKKTIQVGQTRQTRQTGQSGNTDMPGGTDMDRDGQTKGVNKTKMKNDTKALKVC